MMIHGYDLDGVLCTLYKPSKTYRQMNGEERKLYKQNKKNHIKQARCIRKPWGEQIYIITARKNENREDTEKWLIKHHIKYDKLLMLDEARTRDNIIRFKKRMIETYFIDKFFEDDPKIAKKLQKLCPKTTIVLIPVQDSDIVREEVLKEKV